MSRTSLSIYDMKPEHAGTPPLTTVRGVRLIKTYTCFELYPLLCITSIGHRNASGRKSKTDHNWNRSNTFTGRTLLYRCESSFRNIRVQVRGFV